MKRKTIGIAICLLLTSCISGQPAYAHNITGTAFIPMEVRP